MRVVVLLLAVLLAPLVAPDWGRAQSPRLDAALERVAQEWERRGAASALRVARMQGLGTRGTDRVAVVIAAERGRAQEVRRRLARVGARATGELAELTRVWVPVRKLRALSREPGVRFVRPPMRPIPLGFGSIESEGVSLSGASDLHGELVTGEGVKVAVVDIDFLRFAETVAQGELPAGAFEINLTDGPLPFEQTNEHGTAVSEIVMDMAPGVELHAIKIWDEFDLQDAATYIHDNGIRVVNMSLAFPNASYYDNTGVINDIINDSHDGFDTFWVIAAGNFQLMHWEGDYSDNDGDRRIEFDGGSDERIVLVNASSDVCIFLNWDEYMPPPMEDTMDLDLNVYKKSGALQGTGNNMQPASDPAEQVCFPFNGNDAPYEIEVRRRPSSDITSARISIFSLHHNVEFPHRVRMSTLMDPAVAVGAFTVGAINQADWNLPAPNTEGFSSTGPTHDGGIKPDLTGMDRVSAFSRGTQGTSFASPHVAGAAALLLAQDPSLTVLQLRDELQDVAIDQGDPGIDNEYGAGQMVADESLGGLLDTDLDGVGNQADNCRYEPNPLPQLDSGAVGSTVPDGVGDACQCGDLDDDGSVLQSDVDTLRDFFAGNGLLPAAAKCNVSGPADGGLSDCDLVDAVVMARALDLPSPMIDQVCSPALP